FEIEAPTDIMDSKPIGLTELKAGKIILNHTTLCPQSDRKCVQSYFNNVGKKGEVPEMSTGTRLVITLPPYEHPITVVMKKLDEIRSSMIDEIARWGTRIDARLDTMDGRITMLDTRLSTYIDSRNVDHTPLLTSHIEEP
ncbi:Unknown protein, partial [Striga hermonthica]